MIPVAVCLMFRLSWREELTDDRAMAELPLHEQILVMNEGVDLPSFYLCIGVPVDLQLSFYLCIGVPVDLQLSFQVKIVRFK